MDKIPNQPNKGLHTSQNNPKLTQNKKNSTYKGRKVSTGSGGIYIDEKAAPVQKQQLNNRQITSQSLDIITTLAKEQRWEALSSAVKLHGKTLQSLSEVLEVIQKSHMTLTATLQNQICQQFGKLVATAKAEILTSALPTDLQQQWDVLSLLIHQPESHDSPIGIIARRQGDDFIKAHNFNHANRQQIIQGMSNAMYVMVTERMKDIEQTILNSTTDSSIKQAIQHAINERRIEESYRLKDNSVLS